MVRFLKTPGACTVLLLLGLAGPAVAQETVAADAPAAEADDLRVSPRGAFLRSLVVPGWGQSYVGSPYRGGVYFSLSAGSYWMTYVSRRQLLDARREQVWLRETGALPPGGESARVIARSAQVEDWAAISLFLIFLSAADAYVAAYLADFDERIGVLPRQDGGIDVQFRVPVGIGR